MPQRPVEPGTEHSFKQGTCGFCGKKEEGYAKRDVDGNWKPSCWACVKPAKVFDIPKRNKIGKDS